jgi:hypothetical protein
MTDWERVKRESDSDAPIPYDPEDGPYDPNDEAATQAFFDQATISIGWPKPSMVQKDGVSIGEVEFDPSEGNEPRAKAS